MINKQNLWFLTLFSLILVLSVYYITMPNELLLTNNSTLIEEEASKESSKSDETVIAVEESEVVSALRLNLDEERQKKKKELETLLTNKEITTEEKNNAYNELQEIGKLNGQESTIERQIKNKYKFPVFVKIEDKKVTVVIDSDKHDTILANDIMRMVQEQFNEKVYITVQFK